MKTQTQRPVVEDPDEPKAAAYRNYWPIAVRRCWWLTLPFFTLGLAGVIAARLWPVVYRSEALVLVEQQKVPEQYVTSNVLSDLQYRLDSMTQQILSRTRLQRLIDEFGLYPSERARITMDEVIDRMRKDIQVELVQAPGRQNQLTAFRINYSTDNPRTAQRVANELTSLFIEENLRARTQQSMSTTSFLESQLEQAHKALAEQEERLREYKMRFLGELPQQEQGNLQILSSLEAQLRVNGAALDRAAQQKIYLESLRAQYQQMKQELFRGDGGVASAPVDPVANSLEARLRERQNLLTTLRTKYTPQHPDVVVLQKEIAELEGLRKRIETERSKTGASVSGKAAGTPAAAAGTGANAGADDRGLMEIESRLKALGLEIAKGNTEDNELRQRVQEMQKRLNMTPVREQQLAEVTRNYENSKVYYQSLLQKKLGSELATNLEKRQQGEQFRILDPASLPQKPASPNRLQIVAVGWLLGLCVGIGLAALLEIMDTSLRTDKDVALYSAAPVLVRLPVLRSTGEMTRQKWSKGVRVAWVAMLVVLCIGTTVQTYLAS